MKTLPDELSDLTLEALRAASYHAHAKHGNKSLLFSVFTDTQRLAVLVEEIGEVARAMTYDNDQGREHLIKELIQVANMAASWAQWLDTPDSFGWSVSAVKEQETMQ